MKHPKILSEDVSLITSAGYAKLKADFDVLLGREPTLPLERSQRQGTNPWTGRPLDLPQMEISDGIAIIPITGPLGRGLDDWDKMLGCTDVADIEADLDEAEDDGDVEQIWLSFDTPGGMYSGTPELGDRLLACTKDLNAFVGGLCCSAGFWLAAACEKIYATKSADIGCIGVYTTFLDLTAMAEKMGIKVQVFSSGIYKGMGVPGTALTKDQADLMLARILQMADTFYQHVSDCRPEISEDAMQGQTFKAPQALEEGLIDGVVANFEEALDELR